MPTSAMESVPITELCAVRQTGHRIQDILGIKQEPEPQQAAVNSSGLQAKTSMNCPPSKRRRRARTIFTEEQLQHLEDVFSTCQYPDINNREVLAEAISMTEARVQVWFQNRRARLRRRQTRPAEERADSPVPASKPSPKLLEEARTPTDLASPISASADLSTSAPSSSPPCKCCSPLQMYSSPYPQFVHATLPPYGFYSTQQYGLSTRTRGYTVATVPGRYTAAYPGVGGAFFRPIASASVFDASSVPQSTPAMTEVDPTTSLQYSPVDGLLAIARQ